MTDELFEVPESLSPKEAWKRRHGIETWRGMDRQYRASAKVFGEGETEEEALIALAKQLGIKSWNEEAYSNGSH